MALLFLDSFDHYASAQDKYLVGGTGVVAGRHGKGYQGSLRLALTPGSARVIVGYAIKPQTTYGVILGLSDLNATIGSVHTMHDGSIDITMFGGPSARSASDLFRVGQWHYVEFDFTVSTTTRISGSDTLARHTLAVAQVWIDGALVLDVIDLGPTLEQLGPPSVYGWSYLDLTANAFVVIDDLYVCDGSGPAPHNAPLGDVEIGVIRPNGAGATTQWALTGAPTNWDAVNDLVPDGDATLVQAVGPGLSDLYQMEDVATNNGILGAQILIHARRTEEGFANLAPLLRHAGVTTELTPRPQSPSSWYRCRQPFVTMPNGDPLTDAHMSALQAGMRRTL